MPVAVITGASRGLGNALAQALAARGWGLVLDARDAGALDRAAPPRSRAVAGDVSDARHRSELAAAAEELGGADLLVNNASTLGASPLPSLTEIGAEVLTDVFATNVVAPLDLTRLLVPQLLARSGRVLNVSSDAAVEAYEGWGGYGASKAALDLAGMVFAAEQPTLKVYAVDPGDMRTQMHQDAYPGEDLSDLPTPESVVPALLRLVDEDLPSGRYRAVDLSSGAVR
jgi:NAD(P)-dependent dehydrogenase (short-subunit alcohol dehydrogenase family)